MWLKKVGLIGICLLLNACCFGGSCLPPQIELTQQQEGVIQSIVKQDNHVYFSTSQGNYISSNTAEYEEVNALQKAIYLENSLVINEQDEPNHRTITHVIYLDAMKTGKTIQMDEFGRKILILNEQKPWTHLPVWTYQDFAEDTDSQNVRVRFPHELTDIATSRAEQKIRLDKQRPKLIALKIVHYQVTKQDSTNQLTLTKQNKNKPIPTSFIDLKTVKK
ncbi:TPA: hypothetical protein QB352_000477 [Pasteurella multocida]|nr:hypothetical protein [Pasteurella multocida]